MKFCPKILGFTLGFCFLVFAFSLPSKAAADSTVQSSQNVLYNVLENGNTKVRHAITLTNLTTNYYVSEYALSLGFTDIKDVIAVGQGGKMPVSIDKRENGTKITVTSSEHVVGKGNTTAFSISYETGEIAAKNGRIWEINVPRIKDSPELANYTATLSVPPSFGKPSYRKPAGAKGALVFQKEDVTRGISLAFGDYQLFDFTLTYHLQNPRLYPIVTQIALPPTTPYQKVLLAGLEPQPLTVSYDKDGNWLADYRVEAGAKLEVKAKGKTQIFHEPQYKESLSQAMRKIYLAPQSYWESENPQILDKAKELKTPQAIYLYLTDTLTYDYARIENRLGRAGAKEALANPASAICMEFTDLFIALARAAGIPAREIDGFAYAQNSRLRPLSLVKDILHAWPQYYDSEKQMWIAVDPTWGNTSGVDYFDTLDFNHFAFVIKGQDSQYPSPAGSYKDADSLDQKDVDVILANDDTFTQTQSVRIAFSVGDAIVSGFPIEAKVLIENNGNALISENQLFVSSDELIVTPAKVAIDPLPPFGKLELPLILQSRSYIDQKDAKVTFSFARETFVKQIKLVPIFLVYLPWIGGGIGAAFLFIIARFAWGVYLQRQEGKRTLRGESKKPQSPS